jgi:hypothetical protein
MKLMNFGRAVKTRPQHNGWELERKKNKTVLERNGKSMEKR